MDHGKGLLVALGLGPDVLCDQQIAQACAHQVEQHQASGKSQKKEKVLLLQDVAWDQVINGEVGDDYVQGELHQVRFERIPVVIVYAPETQKIENEIDNPEKKVEPQRDSEF
jgi:hypothetical protein